MNLIEEILQAKGKQWAKLVSKRADKLAELHKDDIDIMIKLLNGDIFNQAVEQISVEIKAGLYDEMLQPKEYNL